MARQARADRVEAAKIGAQRWIEKWKSQPKAAAEAKKKGVPIPQPVLGQAAKGIKLGDLTIDRIAALYDTTPDGLVAMFVVGGAGATTALRDVPGFSAALAEARAERAGKVEDWVWRAVGNVVIPSRPRDATVDMVIDMAHFLDRWCSQSGMRRAIRDVEITQ